MAARHPFKCPNRVVLTRLRGAQNAKSRHRIPTSLACPLVLSAELEIKMTDLSVEVVLSARSYRYGWLDQLNTDVVAALPHSIEEFRVVHCGQNQLYFIGPLTIWGSPDGFVVDNLEPIRPRRKKAPA